MVITKRHSGYDDKVLARDSKICYSGNMSYTNQPTTPTTGYTLKKRPADERGRAEHGWLHARFTFSFAQYFDPDHMGFRSLRVMNNDTIEPEGGFGTHPHSDAEIFTYVISGELEHKDSMGNGSVITAGNLQYMSAGSGILHSEFNPSDSNQTELYQIWLRPNQSGGEPLYSEKQLGDSAPANSLTLLFSGTEKAGATQIRQDADISFGKLEGGKSLDVRYNEQHPHYWIQVVKGELSVLGEQLGTGDGLAISDLTEDFAVLASENTDFLLFQLS